MPKLSKWQAQHVTCRAAVDAVKHDLSAEVERLRSENEQQRLMLEQAAAFWRPVARDLEHGVLSIESVRFMAQDFLMMLAGPPTEERRHVESPT